MLQPALIVETGQRLRLRIEQRFPGAGLGKVADKVTEEASQAATEVERLAKPVWWIRIANAVLLAIMAGIGVYLVTHFPMRLKARDMEGFIQFLEPALGSMVFTGAFVISLWSLEARWKRWAVLRRLHALRSLAHVIDMHQLTKDPERMMLGGPNTPASPKRTMTAFELGRYLDYCSELLSILGKIGALWSERSQDTEVLRAVDQVEDLTAGLSAKIWQKMMILARLQHPEAHAGASPEPLP